MATTHLETETKTLGSGRRVSGGACQITHTETAVLRASSRGDPRKPLGRLPGFPNRR